MLNFNQSSCLEYFSAKVKKICICIDKLTQLSAESMPLEFKTRPKEILDVSVLQHFWKVGRSKR
jgi:hypothetical protein